MIAACLAVLLLAVVLVYVLWDHSRERAAWAKERNLLISRIQSPELAATFAHLDTTAEDMDADRKLYAGFDDDADYHKAARRNGEALT